MTAAPELGLEALVVEIANHVSALDRPVVLVLDVSGQAQSAAAIATGFARHRPGMSFAGVVLNRVASPRHEALVRAGMREAGIAVFGALPRREAIRMPSRHLGLVQAEEQEGLADIISEAGAFVAAHCDLDALLAAARAATGPSAPPPVVTPPGQRIALARDAAFSFVYPHLIDGWRRAGAEILPYSPLADEPPDPSADCCWLPGGYPELHAGRLSLARRFARDLRGFAETRPVHGECGGYMAMGEHGMAEHQDHTDMGHMPGPENTLPMMMGKGPFGNLEMGGMFTVLKVRAEQKVGDYSDPGWYKQPPGTRAYEWTGPAAEPPRAKTQGGQSMPAKGKPAATEVQVRKPGPHSGH